MKNKFNLISILAMSLLVAGCGAKSKKTDFFDEEEKTKRPKITQTSTKLDRHWRVGLGKNISRNDAVLSPAILGDSVYAASINGRIYKVSLENGKRIWDAKFKKTNITGGVGVGDGLVLAGTDQGRVLALKQEDGSIAWEATLASEILSSPVVDNNVVVVRTGDGRVYGLSAFDGEVKWTISRNLPSLTQRGESRPLLAQGVAFIGFSDGTLAALEAESGRAFWDIPVSFPRGTNELEGLSDVDTTPLLVGASIYISSYQDITHSLDVANKSIAWSADVSSINALAYDVTSLYISDRYGIVHKLDRNSGEKIWAQEGLKNFSVTAPVSVGEFVVLGDGDGSLYVLNKDDGSFVGRHSLGAKTIVGDPVVEENSIIFIDSSGSLQSLSVLAR